MRWIQARPSATEYNRCEQAQIGVIHEGPSYNECNGYTMQCNNLKHQHLSCNIIHLNSSPLFILHVIHDTWVLVITDRYTPGISHQQNHTICTHLTSSIQSMSEGTFLQNWILSYANTLATYTVTKFQESLQPSIWSTTSHPNTPLRALYKADWMVWILSSAYQNKGMWSLRLTVILIPPSHHWRYWCHLAWQVHEEEWVLKV